MTYHLRLRNRITAAMAFLLVILAPLSALSEPSIALRLDPSDIVTDESAMRIEGETVKLSIEEAIAFALQRNLSLNVQRYEVAKAVEGIGQNRAIYDFNTQADYSIWSEASPSATNLDGADVQETSGQGLNTTLSQLTPWGGTASFIWRNSMRETNSFFATLNPSFSINTDLRFQQPLLRDLGREVTERGILIAQNNNAISREIFETQVAATIQAVVNAYWTLVEAEYQHKVSEESLRLAKELHDQNRIRVEVGTLAPLELVQSEAGIATREEAIIRTDAAVYDAEDELKKLFNIRESSGWNLNIEPDSEAEGPRIEIDIREALETALVERSELSSKIVQNKNLEIETLFRGNQVKPRLDLDVTYGFNGLGGDLTERDFLTGEILAEAPGGYGDALDQILRGEFEGWSVALTFAYPLQNRDAKARRAIADLDLDRGSTELDDLRNTVITEVRKAVRAVETAAKQIDSAKVSRRLEERNLEAEKKRYENGLSTSYRVLEIQEDLTEAASRLVTAIATYNRSTAEYYRCIGRLLEENNVKILQEMAG